MLLPCLDLLGVAASRQSAATFRFARPLLVRRECGALPRRRYGDLPFIEPHAQPVRPQPLRQRAHDRFVLRAVAEEYVVWELVGHGHFLFTRYGTRSSLT